MSKSAARFIRNHVSGRTADLLLDTLYREDVRKNWRNADVLACFLVDTVANAYQCENSTTFADNGFKDMEDAIASYIESNLSDWDQAKFLASSFDVGFISNRLFEMVEVNRKFESSRIAPVCRAFQAYWAATCTVDSSLLTANREWCQLRDEALSINAALDVSFHRRAAKWGAMDVLCRDVALEKAHDVALEMNRCISANFTITTMGDADRDWCLTARQSWMARRKVVRDAACGYNDAFLAFFHATDYETYTHACIAWLHLMDDALSMQEAWHLAQPCAAAEHNAHYYQLLLARRWKEQRVIMTTKDGAFNYILNDAIAGDMVQGVCLCTYTIDFRDGSVFDLRDGSWMPHGFYASVQSKRC